LDYSNAHNLKFTFITYSEGYLSLKVY
jgi:hypothetical protein